MRITNTADKGLKPLVPELSHRLYPALVGLLLGLLQTGLFFQLTFTLSSTIATFLLVTLCWLLGSAVGVSYLAKTRWPTSAFLALALLAYAVCVVMLHAAPFNTRWWVFYAALVAISGFYPGVFFGRMASVYTARTLFLRENNGFIAGLVLGSLLFMLVGRMALWVTPALVAALVYWMGEPMDRQQG
jgi:CDP-diglyceride synthetase